MFIFFVERAKLNIHCFNKKEPWLCVLVFLGCGSMMCARGELPARTTHDPANPVGEEAPPIVMPTMHTQELLHNEHSAHQHGTSTQDAETQAKYTCPMHPEVLSQTPGSCPKCGMTLQLK